MIWTLFWYQPQPNIWIPNVGFKKRVFLKFIFWFSPTPQWCRVGSSICAIAAPAAYLDYASCSVLWARWLLFLVPPQEHQLWGFLHWPLQSCSCSAGQEPAQIWKLSSFVRSLSVLKVLGSSQRAPWSLGSELLQPCWSPAVCERPCWQTHFVMHIPALAAPSLWRGKRIRTHYFSIF